jgi:hypothetical protein
VEILTHDTGKKTTRADDPTADDQDEDEDSDNPHDAPGEGPSYESFANTEAFMDTSIETARIELPDQADRRSTFTFTIDTEASNNVADGGSPADQEEDDTNQPAEDATLTNLFRSPTKQVSAPLVHYEEIAYPHLPQSDNEVETDIEPTAMGEVEIVAAPSMDESARDSKVVEAYPQPEDEMTVEEETTQQDMGTADPDSTSVPVSPAPSTTEAQEASDDVAYPILPTGSSPNAESAQDKIEETGRTSEACTIMDDSADFDMDNDLLLEDDVEATANEEFAEASLQLDIQRDSAQAAHEEQPGLVETVEEEVSAETEQNSYPDAAEVANLAEITDKADQDVSEQASVGSQMEDITDGLTLSFTPSKVLSIEPTLRKLHSPPPPPMQSGFDDVTLTIALDDDTALLKDFLNRAAASKAEKAAVMTHRRESLQNRRDSDVIRHALSSPRKVLEDKDPNSPSKYDNELTLDLSQSLTLSMDKNSLASPTSTAAEAEGTADDKSLRGSRRSSRTKRSRLPAPASAAQAQPQTSKIAIRRPDGTEHVVLKKSDAQELSLLTRANTRKNKQGAFGVTVSLMRLAADAANLSPLDDSTREIIVGKNIRWDEQLAYYQENPETVAEAESVATPDELGMPDPASTPSAKPKSKVSKNSTPKIRRVRGLGTANGTPAKALLAPTTFDDEEKETPVAPAHATASVPVQQLPRPKASKIRKMAVASASAPTPDTKLPSLDIAPVGVEPTKERKSRLAAPKKVMLPQLAAALPAEGKENTQRSVISAATPRKGIPAPKVFVPPTVGMESGLPRRRGRKI